MGIAGFGMVPPSETQPEHCRGRRFTADMKFVVDSADYLVESDFMKRFNWIDVDGAP